MLDPGLESHQNACNYVNQNDLANMLAAKGQAGVTPKVDKTPKKWAHTGFETQGTHCQESKTMAPQKRLMSPKILQNNEI